MNVDRFWELNAGLTTGKAEQQIRERLSALDASDIASYQEHFDRAVAAAYHWNLWAAAYIIKGGCSDDGFIDFRYGLISRGRNVFEAAVKDPDSLANIEDADNISDELFGYVADTVYELKTDDNMPGNDAERPTEPSGEDWDFEDENLCRQKLPKLWAKFGD